MDELQTGATTRWPNVIIPLHPSRGCAVVAYQMPWWFQTPPGPGAPMYHPQYTNYTLVICRAAREDVTKLMLLGRFPNATGLYINYGKSTIAPMNLDAETVAWLADTT